MTTTAPGTRPGIAPAHRPTPAAIWTALAIVYVVWGSTYLAIRVAVQAELPPLVSGGARFVIAAAVLAAVLAAARGPRVLRVTRREAAAAGAVGVLLLLGGNGLVMIAEQTVPSGLAALLIAAVPLWVVVLRASTGDRPNRTTVVGVLLGLGGLALLTLTGGGVAGATTLGVLTVLAASLSWSVGSFGSGRLPMPRDPFVATVWEMAIGGGVMLLVGAARGELRGFDVAAVPLRGWVALGYLIAFGSLVAFTAYVWLLQHAPLSLVATYAYVNPVVAVALGALLLTEPITAAVLAGGGIVVAGVAVVVSTERPRLAPRA